MPDHTGASVRQVFELFSAAAPKGWRVELIEGKICVTPPAKGEHEEFVSELNHQLTRPVPDRTLRNHTGIGLNVPGASETGHVVPDLQRPKHKLGLAVPLPAPLGFVIDTAEF